MALETAQYIHQLNPSYPAGSDRLKQGDDHLRLLKAALQATFPNIKGAVDVSHEFLNKLAGSQIPVGTITLFYGTAAPSGWGICNGSVYPRVDATGNITSPDLRGRVAVGVSDQHAQGTTWGETSRTITTTVAGAHSHTAGTGEAGAHTHSVSGSIGSAKTNVTASATSSTVDAGGSASNVPRLPITITDPGHSHSLDNLGTGSAGAHTHAVSVSGADGHSHSATVDVQQPSMALHYIIKL